MKSLINSYIPEFTLPAYYQHNFLTVSSDDLKGKWSILFFYPHDFCFVCPTELSDMADMYDEFKSLGVEIYAISRDSQYAHKAWHETSPSISKIQFPMLSDKAGTLSELLGINTEECDIIRSTFLVNPETRIKIAEFQDAGIGRSAEELLRKVKQAVKAR